MVNNTKRNITRARYGLSSWLQQRIAAVIMLVIMIWLLGLIIYLNLSNASNTINGNSSAFAGVAATHVAFMTWRTLAHVVWVQVILQLFFIAIIVHAWVGVRDIWMDYVSNNPLRLLLHVLTLLWLVGCFIYSVVVIWHII